ncbi:MaoC family dehydratase [Azospirillum sp. HJ39]|uniref:MaoC family dehydratase n=1 Tax=Azospirillum sp. HJ39 TaxID=3159496 RepID=UPI0035571FB8
MDDRLIERTLRVDSARIRAYAEATQDFNPIHLDRSFAETTGMKGIIAHGTMSLNLIWQSLTATFGSDRAARATLDVRFTAPVRELDVLTSGGVRRNPEGPVFAVWVRNADGIAVIEGTATLAGVLQPGGDGERSPHPQR